jgi:predicted patatin/cPLA2 family phospholipase
MECTNDYDFSALTPFIKKFENLFNKEFIVEELEDYGTLWKYGNCIKSWTLGMC